jgi:hypothetical protein
MAKEWVSVLEQKAAAFDVSGAVLQELKRLLGEAEAAYDLAQSEMTRTPVATARCKMAFGEMCARMRDIKRRYFLKPPLTDADLVSLGLRPHDTSHTATGTPQAQVMIETFLTGRHELGFKVEYVSGNQSDPSNKGYRIWYSVVGIGEESPEKPGKLRESFFTKRNKDIIKFEYGDSGKTAYFAVQVENEGKKGPWGPITCALIP